MDENDSWVWDLGKCWIVVSFNKLLSLGEVFSAEEYLQ